MRQRDSATVGVSARTLNRGLMIAALVACLALAGALAACAPELPEGADEAPVIKLPAGKGVRYSLQPYIGPVASPDRLGMTVTSWGFPDSVAVKWEGGLLPDSKEEEGSRTLTTLAKGKTFEPLFIDGERHKVKATAPWVSRAVYKQLAAGKTVEGFFEGGLSLSGQVTRDTEGIKLEPEKERVRYVLLVDGEPRRIKAIRVNNGAFVIADDPTNPFVLEYKTVGVGWRLDAVGTDAG